MITNNYYDILSKEYYDIVGKASHELKNMISFISSSYQLISLQHPEVSGISFWSEMGTAIDDMIRFMDRTSLCRYCLRPDFSTVNINELLYRLPDETDELYPDADRNFDFYIDHRPMLVQGDESHLMNALKEIASNCYEATSNGDSITINATPDIDGKSVIIIITNKGHFPEISYHEAGSSQYTLYHPTDAEILCKHFYTTKPKHVGVGLTIAFRVCCMHNGELTFHQNSDESSVCIKLPLSNPEEFVS